MKKTPQLDPVLKSWNDNVIVPALVEGFLAEMKKKALETSDEDGVESEVDRRAPVGGAQQ